MKGKIITILLIVFFALISISLVSASQDDNVTLGENNMTDVGISQEFEALSVGESKTFEDVQKEIDSAKSKSTVKLEGTYVGKGKAIVIDKSITIDGGSNKATLDAKDLSRIFAIKKSNVVTLKNLNLVHGFVGNSNGGAIFSSGELHIKNCNFRFNGADNNGGDIYVNSNKCYVESSTFKNGYSTREEPVGEGFYDYGTGSIYNKNYLSLKKCSFSNYRNLLTSPGKLDIYSCSFNSVTERTVNCWKVLTVSNSKFTNCENAVRIVHGSIKNTKFINCKHGAINSQGATVYRCTFKKCSSGDAFQYHEGIVNVNSGKTTLKKCSFINNKNEVIFVGNKGNCKVINSNFRNNKDADRWGYDYTAIKNEGKLSITKNKKTKKYTKHVSLYGNALKSSPYFVLAKSTLRHNSAKLFTVKLISSFAGSKKVSLNAFTSKKSKTFTSKTNNKGVAGFKLSKLSKGVHKIKITCKYYGISKTSKIKIV